jgi:aspartate kinase
MEVLKPILKNSVPVVTGFIAGDEKGRIATLGRGGSDYTAAILGSALKVEEIWIWTDVNGILTTDPKLVKESKTIEILSFIEAMELAYFGAKVLHPKTIEPAMESGIPVRVRNTFNLNNKGTLIVKDQKKSTEVVKAISVMKHVALLTISGLGMIGVPGVAARVFNALATEKVNILMISQGSSEVNISIVIEQKDLENAINTIKMEFSGKQIVRDINYKKNVAIIAVIGAGMQGAKGVAAKVFTAVAESDVNVLMISQGSSEVNISFVVFQKDAKKVANALHDKFIS